MAVFNSVVCDIQLSQLGINLNLCIRCVFVGNCSHTDGLASCVCRVFHITTHLLRHTEETILLIISERHLNSSRSALLFWMRSHYQENDLRRIWHLRRSKDTLVPGSTSPQFSVTQKNWGKIWMYSFRKVSMEVIKSGKGVSSVKGKPVVMQCKQQEFSSRRLHNLIPLSSLEREVWQRCSQGRRGTLAQSAARSESRINQ